MKKTIDNDFEDFLKEQADELRMPASDRVWKGIHYQLHQRRRIYAVAGIFLLLLGVAAISNISGGRDVAAATEQSNASTGNDNPLYKPVAKNEPSLFLKPRSNSPRFRVVPVNDVPYNGSRNTTTLPVNTGRNIPVIRSHVQPAATNTDIANAEPETSAKETGNITNTVITPATEKPLPTASEQTGFFSENAVTITNQLNTTEENHLQPDISSNNTNKPGRRPLEKKPANNMEKQPVEKTTAENILVKNTGRQVTTEFYVTPYISYRKLTDPRNKNKNNPTAFSQSELDAAIYHKPSLGMEAGVSWHLKMSDRIRSKAGLQVNYSRYNIKATRIEQPEIATITMNGYTGNRNTLSNLRANVKNAASEWLESNSFQVSLPVGFEAALAASATGKAILNIGTTIQPSYIFKEKAPLLSTDLKNYAFQPSLNRRFNVNLGVETFFSYNTERLRWHFGPQLRYQLLSSYDKNYPFRENRIGYGFMLGVSKPL
jgi:hypothetical protein